MSQVEASAIGRGAADHVEPWQGFTRQHPCPICGGHLKSEEHRRRCHGYVSRDGSWVYCTREHRAGDTPIHWSAPSPRSRVGTCEEGLIRTFSSADLLAADPRTSEWLVEDRLPRGGSSILVGEAGAGKSTLARNLALCVARGAPWLDFATKQGRVLYVNIEDSLVDLRQPFVKMGLTPSDDVHFLDGAAVPILLQTIYERALQLEPALVIIDMLQPLLTAEERRGDCPDSSPLDRILELAPTTGAHVMLLHHLKVGRATEMGAILGSTARSVDAILMLNRVGDRRSLRSIQHGGSHVREDVEVPVGTDHVIPPQRATREADPDSRLREEILDYLRRSLRLVSQLEIFENVSDTRDRTLAALNRLKRDGKLLRLGEGTKTNPYLYTGCSLVDEQQDPWLRKVRPWAPLS